jgi:hypothetical protein
MARYKFPPEPRRIVRLGGDSETPWERRQCKFQECQGVEPMVNKRVRGCAWPGGGGGGGGGENRKMELRGVER